MKGFTFIEVLLTIGIILILLALSIPLGIHFYRSQQLDDTTEGVIQALRRARLQAVSQSDYSFGVFLGQGHSKKYILFRGNSYTNRDDEEVFGVSSDISFSGLSEVVFSKLDGRPSVVGDIFLTDGYATHTININEVGRISYVLSTPPPPPQGCWGTGGSCDPDCRYFNYGLLVDYFIDPGCSDSCPSAGSFYVNPSEGCSDDGSGTCYKMENPSTQYTSCTQDGSCEGECSGTPVSCNKYHNSQECLKHGCDWETQGFCFGSCNCSRYDQNQCKLCPLCSPSGSVIPPVCKGDCQCRELTDATSCGYCPSCQWISVGPGRCTGTPYPCKEMDTEESCKDHGCQWQDTKWFWNLQDSKQGYSSYTNCQWYVR